MTINSNGINAMRNWSNTRQQILKTVNRLLMLPPFADEVDHIGDKDLMHDFCLYLQKYISIGDLDIFSSVQKISNQNDKKILSNMFYQILEITDYIIDFNDKYFLMEYEFTVSEEELEKDIVNITEKLVTRFDLEDELITNIISLNILNDKIVA